MSDEADIRALLDRYERAIHDRAAAAAVACYTGDIVAYDLAPPLVQPPADAGEGFDEWFATWSSPIVSKADEMAVHAAGDVAWAHCLRHMTGTKTDGTAVDLWFRATAGLRRERGEWRIAHVHNSVPFAMDGSGRALLDLQP